MQGDDANIVRACRRCIPTGVLLLLLSTSGGVEAESHQLFAVGREHVRTTSGPAFASGGAGNSKRKLPRHRERIRALYQDRGQFNVACSGCSGDYSNLDLHAGNGECDVSTRQARIVGPFAAVMAALTTSLPSSAISTASEVATAASLSNIAAEGSYESSLATFFPSSLPVSSISEKVATTLAQHGFSSLNMELLTSLCSDENNEAPNTLINELRSKLGGGLGPTRRLGALAGLPLYAKSSFDICLNRDNLAKKTKILVVYGPHVGIGSADGMIGKRGTGSCGSVLGAYTEMLQKMELERLAAEGKISSPRSRKNGGDDDVLSLVETPGPRVDTMREVQQDYIMQELQKRLIVADLNEPDQNAGVQRVMQTVYGMIDELLRTELDSAIKRNTPWNKGIEGGAEIILIGGITIRGEVKGSEDLFKPLAFDSITMSNDGSSKVKTRNLLPILLDTTTKFDESLTSVSEEERYLERLEEEASRLEREAESLRLEAEEAERMRVEYEEAQKQQSALNDERARVERERLVKEKILEEERIRIEAQREEEEERHRRESMPLVPAAKIKVPEESAMEPAAPSEGPNVSFGVAASSLFALSVGGIVAATSVSRDEDASTVTPPVPAKPENPTPTGTSPSKQMPKASPPVAKSPPPLISSKPTNPFPIPESKSTDLKEEGNKKVSRVTKTFPSLKPKESAEGLNDDYQSSSSEKYQKGFASILDEACDAEEVSASVEDCAPAVKEYFDSVSKGEEKPSAEASDTISNYLDALSSRNKEQSQARVVFPPQSGPAVESYLAKLATGEVKSPPSEGVSSYLDAVSSGATDTPKSAEEMNAEINALMYSILETMRGPKFQALEEACDADEVIDNEIEECAPAISDYIEAISIGEEELSSDAPEVIGGYLDKLSAENTSTNEGGRQGASTSEVSGAVQSYLNEVSTGGIGPPPGSGVSSYLEALSSGETTLPTSGEEIYTALDGPSAPRSYAKAICDECTFVVGETPESCVAAISAYLDYVALMGSSVRENEADDSIVEFFEKTTRSFCGNAVLDYIGEVASSGKAPSAGSLLLYLNSLANGIKAPESGRYISINLNEFENEGYTGTS